MHFFCNIKMKYFYQLLGHSARATAIKFRL